LLVEARRADSFIHGYSSPHSSYEAAFGRVTIQDAMCRTNNKKLGFSNVFLKGFSKLPLVQKMFGALRFNPNRLDVCKLSNAERSKFAPYT
jgi:hypothetical protein